MSGKRQRESGKKRWPSKTKPVRTQSNLAMKVSFAAVLVVLLAVVIAIFYSLFEVKEQEKIYVSLNAKADTLRIPIPHKNDPTVKFYSYGRRDSKAIKFFVARSDLSRSLAFVAFEACHDCYKKGRGFRQSGKDLICTHCGRSIKMNQIDQSRKGCNPLALKNTIEKGRILIRWDDLKQGEEYF